MDIVLHQSGLAIIFIGFSIARNTLAGFTIFAGLGFSILMILICIPPKSDQTKIRSIFLNFPITFFVEFRESLF